MGMFLGRAAAAFALAMVATPALALVPQPTVLEVERVAPKVRRDKARRALASAPARYRRSKNAPTKRKLKANRLHVSRRVRRKHRRRAA